MALWELSFRSRWDYPFIELSREFPDTPISMWCIWNRELLQVPTRDDRTLKGLEKTIRRTGHVVDEWMDSGQGRIFLLNCTCNRYDSIYNIVDAHQCMETPPAVFRDGWGYFRALSFDDRRTRELFRDLHQRGPTDLIHKRELPLSVLPMSVWVHGLFGDLTQKQTQALLQAHRFRYYASPRQIKTEDIARGLGVSRSTYEEHLRKAENRVMNALIPYLQLYGSADHPAGSLPLKRTAVLAPVEVAGQ